MVAAAAAGAVGPARRAGDPTSPDTSGHSPADGFKAGGALPAEQPPGVVLAAVATLSLKQRGVALLKNAIERRLASAFIAANRIPLVVDQRLKDFGLDE